MVMSPPDIDLEKSECRGKGSGKDVPEGMPVSVVVL
jgi:hypothetical protein